MMDHPSTFSQRVHSKACVSAVVFGHLRRLPLKKLIIALSVLFLGACVSTTKAPFEAKKDEKKAVEAYIQLGLAYIERGNAERAKKHLNRALELNPDSAGAHAALGLAYQTQGDNRLAEKSFKKSLNLDPDFSRGRTYYAAYLYRQQKYQEAYDEFERVSKDASFASREQVFLNMARCAEKMGKKDLVYHAYERSLQIDGNQPKILLALSKGALEERRFDDAQNFFNRFVLLVKRDNSITHTPQSLMLGAQLAEHFNNREKVRVFTDLLTTIFPDSPEAKSLRR